VAEGKLPVSSRWHRLGTCWNPWNLASDRVSATEVTGPRGPGDRL